MKSDLEIAREATLQPIEAIGEAMGLLPEEQAMGARMMMGLFAVPGDQPDSLKSKVEFTQDGQVLANGQRLK